MLCKLFFTYYYNIIFLLVVHFSIFLCEKAGKLEVFYYVYYIKRVHSGIVFVYKNYLSLNDLWLVTVQAMGSDTSF